MQVNETYITSPGALRNDERKYRGISHQKTSIAIGTDGTRVIVGYLCDGHPTTDQIRNFWRDRIEIGSSLTHDSLRGYEGAFPQCPSQTWVKSTVESDERKLNPINDWCSGLK